MAVKLEVINARIGVIGNGERTFKAEMSAISREMIGYIAENGDIDAVNRLLAVLTPVNKEKTRSFFSHHLPYNWDAKTLRFGSKSKNPEVVAKKKKIADNFLADEKADIWSWVAEQASHKPEAKAKEYEKKIEALVKKAIEDKDENIPVSAVIRAVIKAGASLAEIMEALMPNDVKGETVETEVVRKRVANSPDEH